jgi:transcriptional regulator GlxA family with amidase domain
MWQTRQCTGRRPPGRRPVAIAAQVAVFDGCDPLAAVSVYEVLRAGGFASDGAVDVALVSPRVPGPGGVGTVLAATGTLDPDRADVVIVPGLAGPAEGRAIDADLTVLMKQALDNPLVTVAAVGDGPLVLAGAGLVSGRHVATPPAWVDLLADCGAVAVAARLVDDGDLVTATGATAGLDLGLYLLERELGPRVASAVERELGYERRGTAWRPAGVEPLTW